MVSLEKLTDEKTKTQTTPDFLEPQRKQTDMDSLRTRIVVVSPYQQINAFLEAYVPSVIKGAYVSAVSRAEMKKSPWVRVAEKESKEQRPLWVFDFQKIIASVPSMTYLTQMRNAALSNIFFEYTARLRSGNEVAIPKRREILRDERRKLIKSTLSNFEEFLTQKVDSAFENIEQTAPEYECVEDVVPFYGYTCLIEQKNYAVHIVPKLQFQEVLGECHSYDERGDFLSTKISVAPHITSLQSDIDLLKSKKYRGLVNFTVAESF
jgi:hypothetical protein